MTWKRFPTFLKKVLMICKIVGIHGVVAVSVKNNLIIKP